MTRVLSRDPSVHRELDSRLSGGGQRGDDIEKLTAATRNRLGARAFPEAARGPRTDTWSKNLAQYAADALYALGAAESTVKAARAGRVTEGAQRMVRYPGTRSGAQLQRAEARRSAVEKRAEAARKQAADAKPPAQSEVDRQRARAAKAAKFALDHAGKPYTQDGRRWNPIASRANPDDGDMWDIADCSSFASWVNWHAFGRGGPDYVNGADWAAGYTGSMRLHGKAVTADWYEPGDCVIYGGGTGKHTAVCWKAGDRRTSRWASHGSANGPYDVPLDYRSDRSTVRRYIGA